jgi:uncharacterized protein (TIGR03435 family)
MGSSAAFGQAPRKLEFEVASIRQSVEQPQGVGAGGVHIDGQQMRAQWLSLKDYIGMAYRIKLPQIVAPDWTASQRFDIGATLPAGTTIAQVPEMLQALLEDRFQMKLHHESKEFPVYVLEIGKGPLKLKPTPVDTNAPAGGDVNVTGGGSAAGISINLGNGSSYTFADNKLDVKKMNMLQFTTSLERYMDRPVIDHTDLKGSYDLVVDLTPEDYRVMLIRAGVASGVTLPPQALRLLDGATTGSLFDGIERLGLKLDGRKAPLDVLVVDQVQKTATAN